MFVAWRDLRFAKGRFALMGAVVLLITTLVGLLSGLTAGLGRQNISAITGLSAGRLAFAEPPGGEGPSFGASTVTEQQWRGWAAVEGVRSAEPIGIALTRAGGVHAAGAGGTDDAGAGGRTAAVAAFGVRPSSGIASAPLATTDGEGGHVVVLSRPAAQELGVGVGDRVAMSGEEFEVAAVAGGAYYSHAPVVWTALAAWQRAAPAGPGGSGPGGSGPGGSGGSDGSGGADGSSGTGGSAARATVIALEVADTVGPADLAALDERLGTHTVSREESLSAIGSYTSENRSLQLMRGFLFAISALVVGAFFTVWTIQRSGDVAVLKALGASTRSLLRDALGQAVVLLGAGTLAGTALAAAAGSALDGAVPFVLGPATVLVPAGVMIALGVLGAALSIRRITSVDPLTALGSAR